MADVLLDRLQQIGKAGSGFRAFDLSGDIRVTASRPDEFMIESAQVDLLFSRARRLAVGYARANFILDDNAKQPSVCRVTRRNLKSGDSRDFIQILALLVSEVKYRSDWNVPYFPGPPRRDPEGGRRPFLFSLDPSNDLPGINIDRVALHRSRPLGMIAIRMPTSDASGSVRGTRAGHPSSRSLLRV